MKRSHPENGVEEGGECVKQPRVPPEDAMAPHMESFNKIQKELQELDEQCAREQMKIQKTYDDKKKPWFEKRQAIIEKVPGFWCHTFQNHPALYIINEDIAILEHLKRIDLDDNLDDTGSYKISFVFDEGARQFMEPLTLVKRVKFENNEENVTDCTEIKWKEDKSPIEAARQRRELDKRCEEWSIFEWFTKKPWGGDEKPDLGEVIRREIWHAPLAYYTDSVSVGEHDDEGEEALDREDYEEDDEQYEEEECDDEDGGTKN